LDKAALDMANEVVSVGEPGDGSGEGGAPVKLEPMVDLGKVVFKGEKFFWRYACETLRCWVFSPLLSSVGIHARYRQ